MSRRRKRTLTDEDRDLWARYSRTAEPLHPERKAAPAQKTAPTVKATPGPAPRALPSLRLGEKAKPKTPKNNLAPSLSDQIRSVPIQMDAKAHRKMTSGKLRPEGKLDLHGMTLDVAHPELIDFVLTGAARGKRLLLVVTGKGKHKPGDGPIPNRLGVLKHQVPQWLRMPPLSAHVLQVTQAHRSHGGEGAYYVYLRRTR